MTTLLYILLWIYFGFFVVLFFNDKIRPTDNPKSEDTGVWCLVYFLGSLFWPAVIIMYLIRVFKNKM